MTKPRPISSIINWYHARQQSVPTSNWSTLHCYAFRTLFLFLLLGEYQLIFRVFSLSSYINEQVPSLDVLTVWFSDFAFGIDLSEARPRTSGSRLYAWMYNATYLMLSMCLAGLWGLIDRRPRSYPILQDALWTLMRMVVALYMFTYGFAKVFGVQFTLPSASILMTEVGALPPNELMKVFMGTSQPYSAIAGWMEILGGVLLCFRRTTIMGATLCFGIMVNILAMNVFYNFGMQRLALELTFIIVLIMTPYIRGVFTLFILNRPSKPIDLYGPWTNLKWRRIGTILMMMWCVANLWNQGTEFHQFAHDYGELGPKGKLEGTWSVSSMSKDGKVVSPLVGSQERWRSISFQHRPKWTESTIAKLDSSHSSYRFMITGDQLLIKEMSFDDDLGKVKLVGQFTYKISPDKVMSLEGEMTGSKLQLTLKHTPRASFPLLNGFVGLVRP